MYQKLLAKTGNYSIAVLASRAAAFILLPVYTHHLSPSDYGVLELLDLLASITGLLVGTQLGQSLFYFYFSAKTDAAKAKWVSAALFGAILLGSVAGITGVFLAAPISRFIFGSASYSSYVTLSLLALSVSVTSEVGYCYMRTLDRVSHYVTLSLVTLGVGIVLNVLFLIGFHLGVRGIQISALVTGVGLAVYMVIFITRLIPVSLDLACLIRMIRYTTPLAIGGLAILVIHYGDRLFLRHRITLGELGIYSLGYKIGMLVAFCHAPFIMHWNSQVSALVRGPDAGRIFARTSRYLAAALISVVVLLSLLVKPILSIIVAPAFRDAYVFVPWVALAYLLRSFGAHMQSVFILEGRPELEARANILGSVCCVMGYALLIPPYKAAGAVAATIGGFFVVLVYSYYAAWRLRRFALELSRIARMILFGAAVIVAFYRISPLGFVNEIGLATGCAAAYGLLLFYCAGFDEEERQSAKTLVLGLLKQGQVELNPVVQSACGRQ